MAAGGQRPDAVHGEAHRERALEARLRREGPRGSRVVHAAAEEAEAALLDERADAELRGAEAVRVVGPDAEVLVPLALAAGAAEGEEAALGRAVPHAEAGARALGVEVKAREQAAALLVGVLAAQPQPRGARLVVEARRVEVGIVALLRGHVGDSEHAEAGAVSENAAQCGGGQRRLVANEQPSGAGAPRAGLAVGSNLASRTARAEVDHAAEPVGAVERAARAVDDLDLLEEHSGQQREVELSELRIGDAVAVEEDERLRRAGAAQREAGEAAGAIAPEERAAAGVEEVGHASAACGSDVGAGEHGHAAGGFRRCSRRARGSHGHRAERVAQRGRGAKRVARHHLRRPDEWEREEEEQGDDGVAHGHEKTRPRGEVGSHGPGAPSRG